MENLVQGCYFRIIMFTENSQRIELERNIVKHVNMHRNVIEIVLFIFSTLVYHENDNYTIIVSFHQKQNFINILF